MANSGKITQVIGPAFRGHMFGHQIPFVDDENAGFVMLFDVTTKLPVDLADTATGVEKHQHHIGIPNGSLSAMSAVKLNVGTHTFVPTQTRRVDGDK